VASRALDGVTVPQVGKATHFHTTAVSPEWGKKLLRVAQVGMHVFYRFGTGTYVPALPMDGPGLTGPALDAANQAVYASLGDGSALKAVGLEAGVEAAAMAPKAAVPRALSPFEVDRSGITETSALSPKEVTGHASSAAGA
jgi:hypothetical protein